MGLLHLDYAIASERGCFFFGELAVAYLAEPCSWFLVFTTILAKRSFM